MNWHEKLGDLKTKHLEIRDVFGGRTRLTPERLMRLISRRLSLIYIAMATLGFLASDPPGLRDHLGMAEIVFVWIVAALCYISLYVLMLLAWGIAQPRDRSVAIPNLLITGVALWPAVIICDNLVYVMSAGSFPLDGVTRLPFYFVATGVFTEVYFQYVAPLTLQHMDDEAPALQPTPASATTRYLHVGTEQLPFAEIQAVESREHFVKIRLQGIDRTYRARLGDIIAQTEDEDGIQPHRSWWVSQTAAPVLDTEDGRPVLRLAEGTVVPVARARLCKVQTWLDSLPLLQTHPSHPPAENRVDHHAP